MIIGMGIDIEEVERVKGAMERVIRVLMHVNIHSTQDDIKHIYLDKAVALRPDLHEGAGQ